MKGREAWHAATHGVAKSRTQLSDWTTQASSFAEVFLSYRPHHSHPRGLFQTQSGLYPYFIKMTERIPLVHMRTSKLFHGLTLVISILFVYAPPFSPMSFNLTAAAAAAKSLQSCPTLCDPIDGSPPGFPIPILLLSFNSFNQSNSFLFQFLLSLNSLPDSHLCLYDSSALRSQLKY